MKNSPGEPNANISLASRLAKQPFISLRSINRCGGCGNEATCLVDGRYPRCEACGNKVINIWNEMRNSR